MGRKLVNLGMLALFSVILLLIWQFNFEIFDYVIKKRGIKIMVMLVVAVSTAMSSLLFQTVTGNRILTPSVLGLDSLYILLNLALVVMLGTFTKWVHDPYLNFFISTGLMMTFSLFFYSVVFRNIKSIYTIVLIGVVMGMFFQSFTGMLQLVLNPDAFTLVMDKLFASFVDIKPTLLLISSVIVIAVMVVVIHKRHLLDVLSLGKDYALNLGIKYDASVRIILVGVFLLVAVSTALVGPITLLGFFSVNMSKTLLKTHRHDVLLLGTIFVAIIMLFIGQFFVERVFNYGIPVSVVLNLVGGGYFIGLLLKENKR